jgi:DNA invertase Pin-like site-specific DNA recombinase
MNIIGYIRVSTDQQVESGLGLEAQRTASDEYTKKIGCPLREFFCDEGLSGLLFRDTVVP